MPVQVEFYLIIVWLVRRKDATYPSLDEFLKIVGIWNNILVDFDSLSLLELIF